MSNFKSQITKKLFFINNDLQLNINNIYVNNFKIPPKTQNNPTNSIVKQKPIELTNEEKNEELDKLKIFGDSQERTQQLKNLVNLDNKLFKKIQIKNNNTGEVIEVESFNNLNSFNKNLLDNRFIGHILVEEWKSDTLFLTLTTQKFENMNDEIHNLQLKTNKIEKLLDRNKIQFIKVFELTKEKIPHIHYLIQNQELQTKIKEILDNGLFNNSYDLSEVEEKDNHKIVNYITKLVSEDNETKIENMGLQKVLKSQKMKLFKSSKSKIFQKNQRSILFVAYTLHIKYFKKNKEYSSEDFIYFCLNYVKHPKTSHNLHLNTKTPHFVINGLKVYSSNNLRIFSKFSRVDNEEKRSIKETHTKIIEFSKIILRNEILEIEKVENYDNFEKIKIYIFNYIVKIEVFP